MRRIRFNIIVLLAISISILNCSSDSSSEDLIEEPKEEVNPLNEIDSSIQGDGSHLVVSYLRQSRALLHLEDKLYDNLTHLILIMNSFETDEEGHIVISPEIDKILTQAVLKRGDKKTKLLLGLPGRNDFFIPLINDPVKMENFVNDMKTICLDYNLDGVDIDWEHPESEEYQIAAGKLAKRVFEILKPEGLLLTQAIIWYNIGHMKQVVNYLDYINLMTYDNFDSNYYHSPYSQFETYIDNVLDKGIPKEKLLAGLPFYGYSADKEWKDKKSYTYSRILNEFKAEIGEDMVTRGDGKVVSFDGVVKIWKKCAYTLEKDLAGVMIWEAYMDVPDFKSEESLMNQVNHVFPVDNN